jgi:hypothetical protein
MALTRTSLSAACTATTHTLSITSTSTGFPAVGLIQNPGQLMLVDSEYMLVTLIPVAGTAKVAMRGYNGSIAAAHDILAPVVTSATASDFGAIAQGEVVNRPPDVWDQVTLGQDGALAVPSKNTNVLITKATACLFTLAAPSKDQDGLKVNITSAVSAAHVLTATTLLDNGLSGSPWTTATWGALSIGGTLQLMAMNGVWAVIAAANGVTLT